MKRKLWIFIGVFVVLLGGYFLLFREKSYKVEVEKVNPKIQRLMSTDKQHFLTKHEFHTKETAERKDLFHRLADLPILAIALVEQFGVSLNNFVVAVFVWFGFVLPIL